MRRTLSGWLGTAALSTGLAAGLGASSPARADRLLEELAPCPPVPVCAEVPPPNGNHRGLRHRRSALVQRMGPPRHRVLDRFVGHAETQIIVGKFAYGGLDKDLEDEDIEIFVRPHCAGPWQLIGTALTTKDGPFHPPVDGVYNRGGQVFHHIDDAHRLPLGRHAVYLRVPSDGSGAEGVMEVVAPHTPTVVVDLDGTLTPFISSEATAFLSGRDAEIRPGAVQVLQAVAKKGHRFYYLSTRPDWLTERARAYLRLHGVPQGVLQLAPTPLGELEIDAETYKWQRLTYMRNHGLTLLAGIGDRPSDAAAYSRAEVALPRFLVGRQRDEDRAGIAAAGGTLVPDWSALSKWAEALPPARCPTPPGFLPLPAAAGTVPSPPAAAGTVPSPPD